MKDCVFCKIVKGELPSYKLYEDDGVSNNFKNGSFAFTDYIFNCSKEKYV